MQDGFQLNNGKSNFWDISNSLLLENNDSENYFVFDSDLNNNLEVLAGILKYNTNIDYKKINDTLNNIHFIKNNCNFIFETINLKDMPPNILNYCGKIYMNSQGNEIITLEETVQFECIRMNQHFKDCKYLQQKNFYDFVYKKFIKFIINSQIFDDFLEKKRVIIEYLRFLPYFMKKYQNWENKLIFKENFNLIEKNEFICSIALLEILNISYNYASNKNGIYDVESSVKIILNSIFKSFPFNNLLKQCFHEMKDQNFSDFYFDYEEMKYLNCKNSSIIEKISYFNYDKNIYWMSKNAFKLQNFTFFLADTEIDQKILLFGENGSGKSYFLTFLSQSNKKIKFHSLNESNISKIFKKQNEVKNKNFLFILLKFTKEK